MKALLRHNMILELLTKNSVLPVEKLATILGVSCMTIRRDLNYLQGQNLLERTHGGAYLKGSLVAERYYSEKESTNIDQKKEIAIIASKKVKEGFTIALDAGTTTLEIVKFLIGLKNLHVITNDLKIALFLSDYSDIEVLLSGGFVRNETKSCIGASSFHFFSSFSVDVAFIGCNAFSLEYGASTPSFDNAYLKQAMIKSGEKVYLVCDSSKYGVRSTSQIANLNVFDGIITDKFFSKIEKKLLTEKGVKIMNE